MVQCQSYHVRFNSLTRRHNSAFINEQTLVTSSLLGKLAIHTVSYGESGKLQAHSVWNAQTSIVAKVNAICVNERYLLVGGITKDQKGAVEVWTPAQTPTQ